MPFCFTLCSSQVCIQACATVAVHGNTARWVHGCRPGRILGISRAAPFLSKAGFSLGTLAVDRTYTGSEQQGQGSSTQRSSGRRGSGVSPKRRQPAGTLPPPKNGGQSSTTTSPGLELGETQEQLVAVARGGVRYAGKVFHRRGVKLTKDSPRSMLPRDVSQSCRPSGRKSSELIGCCTPQKTLTGRERV